MRGLRINNIISVLKENSLFSNEDEENNLANYVNNKLNVQNLLSLYQLVNNFNQLSSSKSLLSYIESAFTTVRKQNCFMELSFDNISKILASSKLYNTSEQEVYHVANKWTSYKIGIRSKLAKELLLRIRLPLLSECTLKYLRSIT